MGRSVLPDHLSGGPHGVGDPENKTLRKVEETVLIPNKVREISRKEKCLAEVERFMECAKVNGISVIYRCRPESKQMNDCLSKWFHDEQFIKFCTEEYLKERSEYRRTGLSKKQREELAAKNKKYTKAVE